MMWIDIGVTLLLTLRMTLSRVALPQLLDPNADERLPEGKDEQQRVPLLAMEEVSEHSSPKSS
jgi:hypothetical protein